MDVHQSQILHLFHHNPDNSAFEFGNCAEFRVSGVRRSLDERLNLPEKGSDDRVYGEIGDGRCDGDFSLTVEPPIPAAAANTVLTTNAALQVQKVYRSYRTRRMLADSAIVAEELWWQALDFARLNHSTISFFNFLKPEAVASRWTRISFNASKVGKGLSQEAKAQMLAFQHWIEAIDPRHRYGHNLHYYFDEWCKTSAGQPFFYWLDVGDGKDVDCKLCPRSKLQQQRIKYLGPKERERYELIVDDGKLLNKFSGAPLDTNKASWGSKWVFVMSTSKRLYAGEKKKGLFHHSSFLAGGATLAAGRLVSVDGVLESISPYSGHYKPTDDSLDTFVLFLRENGVNVDEVKIKKANDDSENNENVKLSKYLPLFKVLSNSSTDHLPIEEENLSSQATNASQAATKIEYKRTLSGGLQSSKVYVPQTSILQRINSKKEAKSNQLGDQLYNRWSTGAGPRIGCIADYPIELRKHAFELTNLAPRVIDTPSTPRRIYISA